MPKIERKSLRLKVLIEDLFEVSRASSGNVKLDPVPVDICFLIYRLPEAILYLIQLFLIRFENAEILFKTIIQMALRHLVFLLFGIFGYCPWVKAVSEKEMLSLYAGK